jgi:hypothetical protein
MRMRAGAANWQAAYIRPPVAIFCNFATLKTQLSEFMSFLSRDFIIICRNLTGFWLHDHQIASEISFLLKSYEIKLHSRT